MSKYDIGPYLVLLGTLITLGIQNYQFNETLREQRNQSESVARLQRDANEDAQWREALKLVSFKDQVSSLSGVFAMQGFFSSPRYSSQARTIASALLTNVPNVFVFDQVMSRMGPAHTDSSNVEDLTSMAQMLGSAQRVRNHIKGTASREKTPFLIKEVSAIETSPNNLDRDKDQQAAIAAWELDTTSHTLSDVWKKLSPKDSNLLGAVLANTSFDGLDFTNVNFTFGILFNSSFKGTHFNAAKLRDVYVREVSLDDSDFSGVIVYDGSRWENSNWWDAKCIPPQMLSYLLKADPHPLTETAKTKLASGCR